jgi:hypothetical protein
METAGCELQALVLATSEKGEVTGAPLDGVVTVIANDGTTLAANATRGRSRDFINPPSNIYLGRILGLARSKLFASKDLPKNWAVL